MASSQGFFRLENLVSSSSPSVVSSYCQAHGNSRWECGCGVDLFTPGTSPLMTNEHSRLPQSSPTQISHQQGYEEELLDPQLFDLDEYDFEAFDGPELDLLPVPAAQAEPVTLDWDPFAPTRDETPAARQERLEQQVQAVPPEVDNPNYAHGPQVAPFSEPAPSTTPATSPTALSGIGGWAENPQAPLVTAGLPCHECGHMLKDNRGLKRHLRWHNGRKPCEDPNCNYTWVKLTDYQRHRKSQKHQARSKDNTFPCRIGCPNSKTFTRPDNLRRHFELQHNMTRAQAMQFFQSNY